jgi:cation diffusion facilitator CzcD-associated flavoprotein CzcO
MDMPVSRRPEDDGCCCDVDVLVVGAGISGLSAAWHLQNRLPGKRFVVLEREASFGGTWLTHKFPGIRSDSDLYTFGFRFKPWVGPPIATAAEIQAYLGEMIEENGLDRHIRYNHSIETAAWDSTSARWTLTACLPDGSRALFRAKFLWMAQGYYRHHQGYWPDWPGMADFKGPVLHTEEWDEATDYAGKRVVLIGSGATAATVVPAMAQTAAHITMIQRSPTWFMPGRNENELAELLRPIGVDEATIHDIVRKKIIHDQDQIVRQCRAAPDAVAAELLAGVQALLPDGYDMRHFTPSYRPWRQRLAFVPDGDLFAGIRAGKADVVTGTIARFTPDGVEMADGSHVPADMIVLATGFNLCVFGDIAFSIDGRPLDLADTVTWRGMMFTGVPNLVWVFGYFRASWTLRSDLIAEFTCRLLAHMDAKGADRVEVALPPDLAGSPDGLQLGPWADPDDFNPNYLTRDQHLLPRTAPGEDWRHTQDYWTEKDVIPLVDLDGPAFRYSRVTVPLPA